MKTRKILKISGTVIDKNQLENYLQKIAISHNVTNKSQRDTYPVPHMLESFKIIQEVYNLLNEHLKLGIGIHPAGEWLLDNFYIIEQTAKQIQKELTINKYINFVGIEKGQYKGFARIYVLAAEIVAYTDNKIEKTDLEKYLSSYQTKKTLSMEEIWNIGTFLQISIIENIREICEKIYSSQMQKYKAENIVERLVENKPKSEMIFKNIEKEKLKKSISKDMRYPFIEYMSYILKRYGKKGNSYLNALEESVELTGTNVSEVIKKEHFDIAVCKVSIANSITSIKKIQRINFLEIFEKVNGVEELLKQDLKRLQDEYTGDIKTEIFGEIKDDYTVVKKLNNKQHRENKRNIYSILRINSQTTIEDYRNTIEDYARLLNESYNKIVAITDFPAYYLKSKETKENDYIIADINPDNIINIAQSGDTIVKRNIRKDEHIIYASNIIFYDNYNKTLPVGMNVSTLVIIKDEEKKQKCSNINIVEENDEFSIKIKKLNIIELE